MLYLKVNFLGSLIPGYDVNIRDPLYEKIGSADRGFMDWLGCSPLRRQYDTETGNNAAVVPKIFAGTVGNKDMSSLEIQKQVLICLEGTLTAAGCGGENYSGEYEPTQEEMKQWMDYAEGWAAYLAWSESTAKAFYSLQEFAPPGQELTILVSTVPTSTPLF